MVVQACNLALGRMGKEDQEFKASLDPKKTKLKINGAKQKMGNRTSVLSHFACRKKCKGRESSKVRDWKR